MYNVIFTESYEKRVRKFLKIHPEIRNQYQKTVELLEINPNHPSLRLHQSKAKNSDFGDHHDIYGKK